MGSGSESERERERERERPSGKREIRRTRAVMDDDDDGGRAGGGQSGRVEDRRDGAHCARPETDLNGT